MAFSGINHIAYFTNDMKKQIEFFTQVVGMELVALFPMHGVPGAAHCFLKMGKDSYMSFVEFPGVRVEGVIGLSHPQDVGGPIAGGAVQHISINVTSMKELLILRDRLRLNGYAVFGPLDHGMGESMYLGGPEGMLLEFLTTEGCDEITPERWVESATWKALGMSASDIERYCNPPSYEGHAGSVPQPDLAHAVYPTPIPRPMFDALGYLSDADLRRALNFDPAQMQAGPTKEAKPAAA